MPPERTRLTLAALAALLLSVPIASGIAGAEPPPDWETAEVIEEPEEPEAVLMPSNAYPRVPGVDLLELGYQGAPIDRDVLDRMDAPLPDEPQARIAELSVRVMSGTPQRAGLAEARRLLQAAVDLLGPRAEQLKEGLAVAQRHEVEAVRRSADAERRLTDRTTRLDDHRQDMAEVAVAAYVSPPDADVLAQVLGGAATTSSDLSASVLFSAKADHDGLVRDELEVSIAVAEERLTEAQSVASTAAERAAATAKALAGAEARAEAHRTALRMVEAALEEIEAQLPVLQADLDQTVEEELARLKELAEAEMARIVGMATTSAINVSTTVVKGIRIHVALAPRLNALLEHAHRDGVPLGGWGYRTTESQIALRAKHCGPTPEDIWFKKASQCSPPTAKPGKSMHERGLAVDFHLAGRSISTRSSPGYLWLAQHAATYGFYNLPSEPWHWSVNAQ